MEEVEMAEDKVTESCSINTPEPSICIKKAEEEEVESLEKELAHLFGYYEEFMTQKVEVDLSSQWSGSGDDVEELVAFMLHENSLPLSKLVDEIYERLNREVRRGKIMVAKRVTYASVRAMVVNQGMRMSFGLPKAGADVWEDSTESCLWCWEATNSDMVDMLPRSVQMLINNRGMCRRRIKDRIVVIYEMLEAKERLKNASIKLSESMNILLIRHNWEDHIFSDEDKLKRERVRQIQENDVKEA